MPSTDPLVAREKGGSLTSLGGSPENSSYKGYGLAVMVNILGACLPGASLITERPRATNPPDIGHCFIAIDPGLFRDRAEFTADVSRLCDDLRATTPIDPATPVMVAGDPQWTNAAQRRRDGIPVGAGLLGRNSADRAGLCRTLALGLRRLAMAVPGPLDGVRSSPARRRRPAPCPSTLMADLGAEVIKVEMPEAGDNSRGSTVLPGLPSTYFETNNRGVKSLTLDLKTAKGREILRRLIAKADIFGQNFRPGAAEKNGFGYADAAPGQSAPRLCLDLRLRPQRPACRPARHRFYGCRHWAGSPRPIRRPVSL